MNDDLHPRFQPGDSALLVSVPHAGTQLPEGFGTRLSPEARQLPDTDWHVDRLYRFAPSLGAGMLIAQAARMVVDLNRPPDDKPLYDASQTGLMTGVVPVRCFSGSSAYLPGQAPAAAEVEQRLERYWHPYHQQLQAALEQIREKHGYALLLDAHSIRGEVPLLFDGRLPDLNLGSNDGRSAAPGLVRAAASCLDGGDYSLVVDGRFKGGYITRHYGRPQRNIHALQLEIVQDNYMSGSPPAWDPNRASSLQHRLRALVEMLASWNPGHA